VRQTILLADAFRNCAQTSGANHKAPEAESRFIEGIVLIPGIYERSNF